MNNHRSTKQRTSNRESNDDSAFYNDLDFAHQQQLPTYKMHAAPRISSDILEVTNNEGAVGFVAVGRLMNYQNANVRHHGSNNPSHFNEFEQLSRQFDDRCPRSNQFPTQYNANPNRHGDSPHARHQPETHQLRHQPVTHHVRHQSEPVLTEGRDILPYNRSLPNTGVKDDSSTPGCNAGPNDASKSNQRVKKSRKHRQTKTQRRTENNSEEPDSSKNLQSNEVIADDDNRGMSRLSIGAETLDNVTSSTALARAQSFANAYPLCKHCGQRHRLSENHEYDYVEEVDDDLQCDICLQPFVDPFDTKCGHTFCSICLKNYVRLKKMCPVDRKELNITSSDCWQSSLVMRKLVDKLVVQCPNTNHCKLTLARSDLVAHLKERCPGSIQRCTFAMFGCTFKGPREAEKEHVRKCKFQHLKGDPVDSLYPDCVKHTVELFRPEGIAELGIAIVGGNDTPIRNIIIQSIVPGSLVDEDGRIKLGDIVIDVNGEDLHNVSHVEARTVLSRSARLMRFTLLREKASDSVDNPLQEIASTRKVAVSLLKPPSEQLGIKITISDKGSPGIYILELVPGRVAHTNGQLQVGDRISEIAHVNLWDGSPEQAARVIQGAGEKVDIVVSRQILVESPTTIKNPWATDKTLPRATSGASGWEQGGTSKTTTNDALIIPAPESQPMNASFREKVISLRKMPNESLGIVVAGGMTGVRGDLPVFVQDIQPMGPLGKDKRLQRGDLLVQVNGVSLTGLSHSQAITLLKDTAQHCKTVSLTAIELNYSGKEEDFALWEELSGVHHQRSRKTSLKDNNWSSWTPSWKMWLAVPPRCRVSRDVVIRRSTRGGLGFSIVGGYNEKNDSSLPVFIKYVVPNSPAATQGRIRSGDEIVAVNGSAAHRMTHAEVVHALKASSNSVVVTLMSWPGSVH